LRLRGVDVRTAFEDGANRLPDPQLLDRATALGRVLFSQDKGLLREAARRQRSGEMFAGLVFSKQTIPIARCIADLELPAVTHEPDEFLNRVEYLPI
jgi:hypothetical protein